jgi:predicted membrane channel-forming protein YqfA (hemolysin III family)
MTRETHRSGPNPSRTVIDICLKDNSEKENDVRCKNCLSNVPFWVHGIAWGGAMLVVVVVVGLSESLDSQNVWANWDESRDLRRSSYAEKINVDALLRTRANTWSNLSYVIVGLYALGFGIVDLRMNRDLPHGYLQRTPAFSLAFAMACCYLGIGSGLFHASLTRFGQQLDVAAMYTPLLVLIASSVGQLFPTIRVGRQSRTASWPFLLLVVVIASWLLFIYKWQMSSLNVLTTLIVTLAALILLDQLLHFRERNGRWLVASTVSLVVAVVCRQLDVAEKFSPPDAWWQGHAFWHVLTSLSLAFVFFYFRSHPDDSSVLQDDTVTTSVSA